MTAPPMDQQDQPWAMPATKTLAPGRRPVSPYRDFGMDAPSGTGGPSLLGGAWSASPHTGGRTATAGDGWGGSPYNVRGPMTGGAHAPKSPYATTGTGGASTGRPFDYASTNPYGPDNNLIGTQITPQDSDSTRQAGDWTQRAGDQYSNFEYSPYQAIDPNAGGWQGVNPAGTSGSDDYYTQLRQLAMQTGGGGGGGFMMGGGAGGFNLNDKYKAQLEKVLNGPDRSKLATDTYNLLTEQGEPEYQKRIRQVGQRGAALGRLGSGMVGSNLVDESRARSTELDQARRGLATDAAGNSLSDEMTKLGAIRDTQGALSNANAGMYSAMNAGNQRADELAQRRFENMLSLGRDTYGHERDTYGDTVSERDKGSAFGERTFDRRQSEANRQHGYQTDTANLYGRRFGDMSGYRAGERANDASRRNELRGERDYQNQQDKDAQDARIRQRLLEEQLRRGEWGYTQDQIGNTSGIGFQGNPTSTYTHAADQYGQQGSDAMSGVGDWLSQFLSRQRRPSAGSGSGSTGTTVPYGGEAPAYG